MQARCSYPMLCKLLHDLKHVFECHFMIACVFVVGVLLVGSMLCMVIDVMVAPGPAATA